MARHSRASSLVSTRTKFSTTTTNTLAEDTRSVDLSLDGQYFRISRDGSRISADEPPPYTGPGEIIRFHHGQHWHPNPPGENDVLTDKSNDDNDGDDDDDDEDTEDGAITPRSTNFSVLASVPAGVGANSLDPTGFVSSPVENERRRDDVPATGLLDTVPANGLGRRASYEAGEEDVISVPNHARDRTIPTIRRIRTRLPTLITSPEGLRSESVIRRHRKSGRRSRLSSSTRVRSAGPVLSTLPDSHEPRSPDYIGGDAVGLFPQPGGPQTSVQNGRSNQPYPSVTLSGARAESGETTQDADEGGVSENHSPLAMDTENDISLHYARMMRKLDYDHRKALHLKDKELAELRERLHEKDTVLRQQLRMKDFVIDDLKTRLTNLQEEGEERLERARNQVEDLWETRWKDRDFHLRERMRRMEDDFQKIVAALKKGQRLEKEAGGPRQP